MRKSLYDHCLETESGLLTEWDADKNAPLTPQDISYGSKRKAWWRCERGHSWEASISSRTRGSHCPVCAGKIAEAGVNDLATLYPQLMEEWVWEKNGGLRPETILPSSHKRAWWRCAEGHEWCSHIIVRTRGCGCPYCAKRAIAPEDNSLAAAFPQLAAEWAQGLNGALTPSDVAPGSRRKAWWRCGKDHVWLAEISSRTRGCGCPYCAGKRINPGENDLASVNPRLAAEWNSERNGALTPQDVTEYSNRRVWWRCSEGHVWRAVIYSRALGDRCGCPVCAGKVKQRTQKYPAYCAPKYAQISYKGGKTIMTKRMMAMLMAVAMAVSLLPMAASSADEPERDGSTINIDVIVDGAECDDLSGVLTVSPLGNSSFDTESAEVNFKFTRYDCKDILFTAADGYVIEGVKAELVYGQSGNNGIISTDSGVLADNVKGGSTVTVYLQSVYSIVYHDENGDVLTENTVEAITAGRTSLAVSNIPMTEEQYSEADENGAQEGYEYCCSTGTLNTCEIIAELPEDRSDYVYDGWYVGTAEGEVKLQPGTVFYGDAYSFELLDTYDGVEDHIINLYYTGTALYTITVRYENEAGEALKEPSARSVTAGSQYNVFAGIELMVGASHNGIFYVFDGLKDGDVEEGIATGDVEVTFIYSTDVMGDVDGGSDGVADKYQAFIIYRSNNSALGTVSQTGEAIDLREDFDSEPSVEDVSISGSTAVASSGARFTGWTLDGEEISSDAVLKYSFDTVVPGAVYTFVANFSA